MDKHPQLIKSPSFKLPKDLEEAYQKLDFNGFAKRILDNEKRVHPNELHILQLYFAFMGWRTSEKEKVFLKQVQVFLKDNIQCLWIKLNPSKTFDFSEKNVGIVWKMFAEIDDP